MCEETTQNDHFKKKKKGVRLVNTLSCKVVLKKSRSVKSQSLLLLSNTKGKRKQQQQNKLNTLAKKKKCIRLNSQVFIGVQTAYVRYGQLHVQKEEKRRNCLNPKTKQKNKFPVLHNSFFVCDH